MGTPSAARRAVNEGWHRDLAGDLHTEAGLTTAAIYLDDMTRQAGATQIVPRSHLGAFNSNTLAVAEVELPEEEDILDLEVPAGTVVFLHCLVVHSAAVNLTDVDRRILFNEYKTAQALEVIYNPAAFGDLPLMRRGRPLTQLSNIDG